MSAGLDFKLNGELSTFEGDPMRRLLDVLREERGLTGTKEGCGEGECGACTVLLDGDPVCSCLVPMIQVAGRRVDTIEGATIEPSMQQFIDAFVRGGGVQCGACTPGIIVAVKALLDREPRPTRDQVRDALEGNLCRCTGYEPIFRAIDEATR